MKPTAVLPLNDVGTHQSVPLVDVMYIGVVDAPCIWPTPTNTPAEFTVNDNIDMALVEPVIAVGVDHVTPSADVIYPRPSVIAPTVTNKLW
jgi:hypothetical protein